MKYKILEIHAVYKNSKLVVLAVLWDDYGNVRATYSNLNPKAGYEQLTVDSEITPEIIQRVAGHGSYVDEERREKYFQGDRSWSK